MCKRKNFDVKGCYTQLCRIIYNKKIEKDIYLLKTKGKFQGKMGQFYMLKGWNTLHPILARPFAIFDIDSHSISFLYKIVGEGTKLLSNLKRDDNIQIMGPYGNGFPQPEGNIALIGGGMGIAALFLAAKQLYNNHPVKSLDIFLGFKDKAILTDFFQAYTHKLVIDIGNLVSSKIDIYRYDYIFACGPEDMIKTLVYKNVSQKKYKKPRIYISLEKRMACGVGACLSCSCKTKNGNKLVCKDGPVFPGENIIFE